MAVRPPDEVIAAVGMALGPARRSMVGPRWARPEQWHLTLQFLGPVASLPPVTAALETLGALPPFTARLGGAGAFPTTRRARVLWIGTETGGEAVAALARAVNGVLGPLGYEADRDRFRSHLTVARLRVPADVTPALAALGDAPVGPAWTVEEVLLYESRLTRQGSHYSVLARVPLAGGP